MIDTLKLFLQEQWNKEGYVKLTPVQAEVMPHLLAGKDVLAASPTGSGKTLSYLLPVLNQLNEDTLDLQVVILASSHELVMQIFEVIQDYKVGSSIRVQALIGSANVKRQIEKLKKKPHIIVGTPGRVEQLIQQKKLKMHKVKTIILDEVDQLLLVEHLPSVFNIIEAAPRDRQLACFSATLNPDRISELNDEMNEPITINIHRDSVGLPDVEHGYLISEFRDKGDTLRRLFHAEKKKTLVFFHDIYTLTAFFERLDYRGVNVSMLHSDIDKEDRKKAIKAFKKGEIDLLLATDVAARGLDVIDLEQVVQMDVPRETDQYIHRSGRTGRMGAVKGKVISIVTQAEYQSLKKTINKVDLKLVKYDLERGQLVSKAKDPKSK